MEGTITLDTEDVSYSVRRSSRAKRMRLVVHCDGSVVVTLPNGVAENYVTQFLLEKQRWLLEKIAFFRKVPKPALSRYGKEHFHEHKDRALELVQRRIKHYCAEYAFQYNTVTVRNQKTRWGSCSRKRNLNFNYKILSLPEHVQDYIIAHELCHLVEFNHSQKFWTLVEKFIPNYVKIRKELRGHAMRLT